MAEQAEAAKEGEEDEGLLLQQAQSRAVPSKLSRYFDPEDKTALFRAEKLWDEEETAALIGRKSVPLVKLTRAQSAKRRDLIEKLGAGTLTEKEEVGNFQITRQLPRFSLDTDDASAWRRPGQSMVREYLHLTQSRSKALRVSKTVRHFPPLLAQQSAIRFYVDTRDGVARYNPYADVEAIFGSRKRSMEALLRRKKKRADPYKANAYLDQDDALAVSKRAREIRLTITQLGLTQAAVRGHRKAGDDDKRDMATSGDAWRAMRVQPTKITVDEIKKWKLLGEKDPRLEVAPSARRGHTMIKIDPVHALVFGGALGKGFQYSSQLFCFNLHTQKFEMMDVTGTRPCGRAFHSAICSDHTKMVIFGGLGKQGSLDDCFEYSIKDQQWGILFQKGAVRPTPRYGHTMTETNEAGMMLLYGGAGAGFFGDLFSLDARTGEWVKLAPDGTTPAPRAFHSAISLESAPNTKMVIFGGQNESANLHDLHEYHMASNTWTFVRTHGMQPTPRWSHSVVKRGADSFILFGGAGERFFDQVLVYNSYKQSWSQFWGRGQGPGPRWGHSCVNSDEMGLLFVFGGCNKNTTTLRDMYELKLDQIIPGAPPKRKRLASGEEEEEENWVRAAIREEKSAKWEERPRSNVRRWSASAKRHTQGCLEVLTEVAPFALRQKNLYRAVGFPTIGKRLTLGKLYYRMH